MALDPARANSRDKPPTTTEAPPFFVLGMCAQLVNLLAPFSNFFSFQIFRVGRGEGFGGFRNGARAHLSQSQMPGSLTSYLLFSFFHDERFRRTLNGDWGGLLDAALGGHRGSLVLFSLLSSLLLPLLSSSSSSVASSSSSNTFSK